MKTRGLVTARLVIPGCPEPPDFRVDRARLLAALPALASLDGCAQDPIHHAEGDALTHTLLVCEALAALPAFRAEEEATRQLLFAAAALHDLGKAERSTRDAEGRVHSAGHAARGAVLARRALIALDPAFPVLAREAVVALVREHPLPAVLVEKPGPLARRRAIELSQTLRCDVLALLAEADVRGRCCDDQRELLDRVELFRELCRELGCLDRPRAFPSAAARVAYFRSENLGRDPALEVGPDESRCEVVLLSGLPGAGKDHHLARAHPALPVVSLDRLRTALGVDPRDAQGQIGELAREQAREHLRAARSFAWSATNLTRRLRARLCELFFAYRARVRIVYVEAPLPELLRRNRVRPGGGVPERVIRHLLDELGLPDLREAHAVEHLVY